MLTLLFALVFFVGVLSVAEAASFSLSFGGRLSNGSETEAKKVWAKLIAGFTCNIDGQTFDIIKKSPPIAPSGPYLVSFDQLAKAGNTLRVGQQVLGRYNIIRSPVATCTNEEGATVIVYGYKVTLQFGVSKI